MLPQLHLACVKDETRTALEHIQIDKAYTVATNAHILVWFETSNIFDQDFIDQLPEKDPIYIHSEDWKKIFKQEFFSLENNVIKAQGKGRPILIETVELDVKYPNFKVVIPNSNETPLKEINAIALNIPLLNTVNTILGKPHRGCLFNFYGKRKSVIVAPSDIDTPGKAIIMPLALKETEYRTIPTSF